MAQYITPAGFKVLKDEFEQLKSVERPKVVQEVSEAAAQGDRSENAEYIDGKKRLREIDARLRFLSHSFESMQVVDPKTPRGDKVFFGATVTLYDNDHDTEIVYQLVGPLDTIDSTHISYNSPIGQALLGKSVDDDVTVKTPKEMRHFTILDVKYE